MDVSGDVNDANTMHLYREIIDFIQTPLVHRRTVTEPNYYLRLLINDPQILLPRLAVRVQVRLLTQTNSPLPGPRALIIESRRMIHAPIIPNRQIIHILPPLADLQIVILHNQLHKPVQSMLALFLGQPVDLLHVVANCEDRLPACHWVGSNHGVLGD